MTPRTTRPGMRGLRTLLILLLLFLAAWVPRSLSLDQFVTADEPGLLFRSANFYQALTNRDLANTVQLEHPGVTVTWAGALALLQRLPGYAVSNPGQLTVGQLEPWLLANTAITPLELLTAGRRWIVLWVALLVVVSYFPLRKLWGAPLAALAVLMLAWDPFLLASDTLAAHGRLAGLLERRGAARLPGLAAWWATVALPAPFGRDDGARLAEQVHDRDPHPDSWTAALHRRGASVSPRAKARSGSSSWRMESGSWSRLPS